MSKGIDLPDEALRRLQAQADATLTIPTRGTKHVRSYSKRTMAPLVTTVMVMAETAVPAGAGPDIDAELALYTAVIERDWYDAASILESQR